MYLKWLEPQPYIYRILVGLLVLHVPYNTIRYPNICSSPCCPISALPKWHCITQKFHLIVIGSATAWHTPPPLPNCQHSLFFLHKNVLTLLQELQTNYSRTTVDYEDSFQVNTTWELSNFRGVWKSVSDFKLLLLWWGEGRMMLYFIFYIPTT